MTLAPFTVINDEIAPTVVMTVPAQVSLRFEVRWLGLDLASGIRHYDVQFKSEGAMTWTDWLTETTQTAGNFRGRLEQTYRFRVHATDNVNNVSAWVESGPVEVVAVTKYYSFGGQRVAMRQGSAVYYLHGDHLGSVSLTTDSAGRVVNEQRFLPYGGPGWSNGSSPTDFGFTSQRLERGFGLIDFNARFYSAVLGRFVSADTIVPEPGGSQGFNRYAYVKNNPCRYADPSGHCGADQNPDGTVNESLTEHCKNLHESLQENYGISISGEWTYQEMRLLGYGLERVVFSLERAGARDPLAAFKAIWGGIEIERKRELGVGRGGTDSKDHMMLYDPGIFNHDNNWTVIGERDSWEVFDTIAHELAHVWDLRKEGTLRGGLQDLVGGRYEKYLFFFCPNGYCYRTNDISPSHSEQGYIANEGEDWADTFAAFVVNPVGLINLNTRARDLRTPYVTQKIRENE